MYPSANSSKRGFSLVETMAAVFVLTVAIFAVFSVNAFTLKQSLNNKNHQTANTIASAQLEAVETVLKTDFHCSKESLEVVSPNETDPAKQLVASPVGHPEFIFQVQDFGYEGTDQNLRTVNVIVAWDEKGVGKTYELQTTFYNY